MGADDVTGPDPLRPPEYGGEAPCFAPDVCAECGLLIEDRLADLCPRCGAPRDPQLPG